MVGFLVRVNAFYNDDEAYDEGPFYKQMDGCILDLNGGRDMNVYHRNCLGCYALKESHKQGSVVYLRMHLGHCIGEQSRGVDRKNALEHVLEGCMGYD